MEQWKDITGYEGTYQISNYGRVRNIRRNRILTPHLQGSGYLQTCLCDNGQRSYPLIHRLVAQAFIPNYEDKPQINHVNGVKTDNHVSNLEWCTMSENLKHRHTVLRQKGGASKSVICLNTNTVYPSMQAAADALGLNRSGVSQVCRGKQISTGKPKYKFLYTEE